MTCLGFQASGELVKCQFLFSFAIDVHHTYPTLTSPEHLFSLSESRKTWATICLEVRCQWSRLAAKPTMINWLCGDKLIEIAFGPTTTTTKYLFKQHYKRWYFEPYQFLLIWYLIIVVSSSTIHQIWHLQNALTEFFCKNTLSKVSFL